MTRNDVLRAINDGNATTMADMMACAIATIVCLCAQISDAGLEEIYAQNSPLSRLVKAVKEIEAETLCSHEPEA